MTTDDRVFEARLTEMLHRVTPEPPRTVTVEDVAIRLANQTQGGRAVRAPRDGGRRRGRNVTGPGRGGGKRRWTPLLAAASVVVVAGASTGIAVALSGNSKNAAGPTGGVASNVAATHSTSGSAVTTSAAPAQPVIGQQAGSGRQPWGAVPRTAQTINAGTLADGDGALFGLTDSQLLKLSPATGDIAGQVGYPSGFPNQPPVVSGHTVWLVWNYSAGGVELRGFSASSLAQQADITVSGSGGQTGAPDGILAATPAGHLWVAAGSSVKLIDASGSVLRTIPAGGVVSSVAASPDGGRVYVGTSAGGPVRITEYDAATGADRGGWTAPGQLTADLVASDGGVWVLAGNGQGQLWFAPAADPGGARVVISGDGLGYGSVPTYAGGVIFIGGPHAVRCLDPATGAIRASAPVAAGSGSPGGFGDVVIGGGHALALYLSNGLQAGAATPIYPAAACFR